MKLALFSLPLVMLFTNLVIADEQPNADPCLSLLPEIIDCVSVKVDLFRNTSKGATLIQSNPLEIPLNRDVIACCTGSKTGFRLVRLPANSAEQLDQNSQYQCDVEVARDVIMLRKGMEDGGGGIEAISTSAIDGLEQPLRVALRMASLAGGYCDDTYAWETDLSTLKLLEKAGAGWIIHIPEPKQSEIEWEQD